MKEVISWWSVVCTQYNSFTLGSDTEPHTRSFSVAATKHHDQGNLRKAVYFALQIQRMKVLPGREASKQLTVVVAETGSRELTPQPQAPSREWTGSRPYVINRQSLLLLHTSSTKALPHKGPPNSAINWGPSLQITELREEYFSFKPPMAIKIDNEK